MGNRIEFDGFGTPEFLELRERQQGLCAFSGEPLNETAVLHHVIPADHGGARTPETDGFVADWHRNGVLVNDEIDLDAGRDSGPHIHAHGGSFRDGPFASFSAFEWSHGTDSAAHKAWASHGEQFIESSIFVNRDTPSAREHANEDTPSSNLDG